MSRSIFDTLHAFSSLPLWNDRGASGAGSSRAVQARDVGPESRYSAADWTHSTLGVGAALRNEAPCDEVSVSSGPRISMSLLGASDLTAEDGGRKSPRFLVAATKSPSGANLERVQIVKGWVDASGRVREKVYDVLWAGNGVDATAAAHENGGGAIELTVLFEDPEFHPTQRAFYYARAIEIPAPRRAARAAVPHGDVAMAVSERSVSSPIWYPPPR